MRAAIGIDIGGTAIKGGIVSKAGHVLAQDTLPTENRHGVDHVIRRIADLVVSLRERRSDAELTGLGLGVPGIVRRKDGLIVFSPNLPGWENLPLAELVKDATGLNVTLENDANGAALGEFHFGAGRGCESLVLLTLGTGVGSGIVLDGKLWRGADECGAELGHMIVVPYGEPCGCSQGGCLEVYASAANTAKRAADLLAAGEASSLQAIVNRNETISAEHVAAASSEGDPLAARVWKQTCRYLALACVNIQHVLNPECVVFAGGMSGAGEQLLRPVREEIARLHSPKFGTPPDVRIATLGNDAGFIGAALSVF